jgi:hypothetical protein
MDRRRRLSREIGAATHRNSATRKPLIGHDPRSIAVFIISATGAFEEKSSKRATRRRHRAMTFNERRNREAPVHELMNRGAGALADRGFGQRQAVIRKTDQSRAALSD